MSQKSPLLILASTSPRRKELLTEQKVPFTILAESIEESTLPEEAPLAFATRMAESKAQATQKLHLEISNAIFLGADTIGVLDGKIFGKPNDEKQACEFLQTLQSRTHQVITAFALISSEGELIVSDHDSSAVTIRALTTEKIAAYVGTGEPMDKAGAYAAQGWTPSAPLVLQGSQPSGLGNRLIEKIEGSLSNVIGLPVEKILPHLKKLGII